MACSMADRMDPSRNPMAHIVRSHGQQRPPAPSNGKAAVKNAPAGAPVAGKGHRGISGYNPRIVSERLAVDTASSGTSRKQAPRTRGESSGASCTSFTLPNLTDFERLFAETIWHDLVDSLTMETLQKRGRLNWLSRHGVSLSILVPLHTTGDGNCLLHAASLAMWGHHDRFHALRRAVCLTLEGIPLDCKLLAAIHPSSCYDMPMDHASAKRMAESIHRRWMWQVNSHNMESCGGFSLTTEQWEEEWHEVLEYCSSEDNGTDHDSPVYHALEEVHIFTLAQVLRRPVIVIADKHVYGVSMGPIAPIYYSGIYLPLLVPAELCSKVPVLLTYLNSHFCGLVTMDTEPLDRVWRAPKQLRRIDGVSQNLASSMADVPRLVPLEMPDEEMMELQFSYDPGEGFSPSQQYGTHKMSRDLWNSFRKSEQSVVKQLLLCSYMNMFSIAVPSSVGSSERDSPDAGSPKPARYFPSRASNGYRSIILASLSPTTECPGYRQFVTNYFASWVRELSSASYNAVIELDRRTFSDVLYEFKTYRQDNAALSTLRPISEPRATPKNSPGPTVILSQERARPERRRSEPDVRPDQRKAEGSSPQPPPPSQTAQLTQPAYVQLDPVDSGLTVVRPKLVADTAPQGAPKRPPPAKVAPGSRSADPSRQPSWTKFELANSSNLPPAPTSSAFSQAARPVDHGRPARVLPAPSPAPAAAVGRAGPDLASRVGAKSNTADQSAGTGAGSAAVPAVVIRVPPVPVLSCRVTSRHELEVRPRPGKVPEPSPVKPSEAPATPSRPTPALRSSGKTPKPTPAQAPSPKSPPRTVRAWDVADSNGYVLAGPPTNSTQSHGKPSKPSASSPSSASSQLPPPPPPTEPPPLPVDVTTSPTPSPTTSSQSLVPQPRPRAGSNTEKSPLYVSDTARPRSASHSNRHGSISANRDAPRNHHIASTTNLPITNTTRDMILRNRVRHGAGTENDEHEGDSPSDQLRTRANSAGSSHVVRHSHTTASDEPIYENAVLSAPKSSSYKLQNPRPAQTGSSKLAGSGSHSQSTAAPPEPACPVYENVGKYTPVQPSSQKSPQQQQQQRMGGDGPALKPSPPVASKPVVKAPTQRCSSCGNLRTARTMTCSECFQHWQRQSR